MKTSITAEDYNGILSDIKASGDAGSPYYAARARREYHRQWRAKNPDKVKAAQQRYWARRGAAAEVAAIEANKHKYNIVEG